jgi:hypothetical protein
MYPLVRDRPLHGTMSHPAGRSPVHRDRPDIPPAPSSLRRFRLQLSRAFSVPAGSLHHPLVLPPDLRAPGDSTSTMADLELVSRAATHRCPNRCAASALLHRLQAVCRPSRISRAVLDARRSLQRRILRPRTFRRPHPTPRPRDPPCSAMSPFSSKNRATRASFSSSDNSSWNGRVATRANFTQYRTTNPERCSPSPRPPAMPSPPGSTTRTQSVTERKDQMRNKPPHTPVVTQLTKGEATPRPSPLFLFSLFPPVTPPPQPCPQHVHMQVVIPASSLNASRFPAYGSPSASASPPTPRTSCPAPLVSVLNHVRPRRSITRRCTGAEDDVLYREHGHPRAPSARPSPRPHPAKQTASTIT